MTAKNRHSLISLLVFLGLVAAVALLGALFPPGDWYAGANRPAWTPPDAVFGPVWMLLYLMMAVAAWLVWRRRHLGGAGPGLVFWGVQLVLNAAWSWLFFGLHRPGVAMLDMALLWVFIALTIACFHVVSRLAAWLMVPYLAWVTFALALNYEFWRLNGGGFFGG